MRRIASYIAERVPAPDPHHYVAKEFVAWILMGNTHMRENVKASSDFDRLATEGEVFDRTVLFEFGTGLNCGQLYRGAVKAVLGTDVLDELQHRMTAAEQAMQGQWSAFDIRTLVQLQLKVLSEAMEWEKRKK